MNRTSARCAVLPLLLFAQLPLKLEEVIAETRHTTTDTDVDNSLDLFKWVLKVGLADSSPSTGKPVQPVRPPTTLF